MVLLQNTSILNAALASATVCDVLLQILFALGAIMLVMCFAGLSVGAQNMRVYPGAVRAQQDGDTARCGDTAGGQFPEKERADAARGGRPEIPF